LERYNLLGRDGNEIDRFNQRHPDQTPKKAYITTHLEKTEGPIIAATDYMRAFSEQVRAFVPRRYVTLGTDGFGRSDTRNQLRHFFEVDRYHIAYTALKALMDDGKISLKVVEQAMQKYKIDSQKPNPMMV
jgi:pyruvate dehydrogenase E1 component